MARPKIRIDKKRDWYRCVICNVKSSEIQAHHIRPVKNYHDLIFDVSNGVTLCVSCHDHIRNKEDDYIDMFDALLADQSECAALKDVI